MYESFLDELQKLAASRHRMAIPQTRSGRRSMRVDTMLKKDKEGTLFKESGLLDVLKAPIPGTKDWFINTGKGSLGSVASNIAKKPAVRMGSTTRGGITSIGEHELRRLGFGDLAKNAFALHGHTKVQGLPIAIENRKSSVRNGVDDDGKPWSTKFKVPYGYIKGTKGKDGEEIDAYVGPDKDSAHAFVVHQRKADGRGHDEDKVMLGFKSEGAAKKAYLDHYDDPKFLGPVSTIQVDELKKRLREKREHTKLAYETENVPSGIGAQAEEGQAPDRRRRGDVPSRDGTATGAARVEFAPRIEVAPSRL